MIYKKLIFNLLLAIGLLISSIWAQAAKLPANCTTPPGFGPGCFYPTLYSKQAGYPVTFFACRQIRPNPKIKTAEIDFNNDQIIVTDMSGNPLNIMSKFNLGLIDEQGNIKEGDKLKVYSKKDCGSDGCTMGDTAYVRAITITSPDADVMCYSS